MKRTFIIWIIAIGLLFNALDMIYRNIESANILISPFVWGAISITGAYGIFNLKKWSQYVIVILSTVTLTGWFDGLLQIYRTGWPYKDSISTFASIVPGFFFVLWWVGISIFIVLFFKKNKRT